MLQPSAGSLLQRAPPPRHRSLLAATRARKTTAAPAQSSWQHHVSSTFYGGGVTEILTPLTLMMNAMGIETGWRMIQGTPAFFNCTKKLHNTLQGEAVEISKNEKAIYERVVFENATRLHIEDADAVIVHDPNHCR